MYSPKILAFLLLEILSGDTGHKHMHKQVPSDEDLPLVIFKVPKATGFLAFLLLEILSGDAGHKQVPSDEDLPLVIFKVPKATGLQRNHLYFPTMEV